MNLHKNQRPGARDSNVFTKQMEQKQTQPVPRKPVMPESSFLLSLCSEFETEMVDIMEEMEKETHVGLSSENSGGRTGTHGKATSKTNTKAQHQSTKPPLTISNQVSNRQQKTRKQPEKLDLTPNIELNRTSNVTGKCSKRPSAGDDPNISWHSPQEASTPNLTPVQGKSKRARVVMGTTPQIQTRLFKSLFTIPSPMVNLDTSLSLTGDSQKENSTTSRKVKPSIQETPKAAGKAKHIKEPQAVCNIDGDFKSKKAMKENENMNTNSTVSKDKLACSRQLHDNAKALPMKKGDVNIDDVNIIINQKSTLTNKNPPNIPIIVEDSQSPENGKEIHSSLSAKTAGQVTNSVVNGDEKLNKDFDCQHKLRVSAEMANIDGSKEVTSTGNGNQTTETDTGKTPDSGTDRLMLANWGLPDTVLKQYHARGITTMFEWQAECLCTDTVLAGGNLVYSAPTSAGKTMVAELLVLKRIVETKKKAIIILPFVSVTREKMFYLQELYQDAGIRVNGFMGSHSPPGGLNSVDVAVCTIEKGNGLINRMLEENKLDQLGIIVVDELHLVGDPHRGYLLELLLTKICYVIKKERARSTADPQGGKEGQYNPIQIIGMSATLPNLDLLAGWLNAKLYHTDFRPVPLTECIKMGTAIYSSSMTKIRDLDLTLTFKGDEDHVIPLCLETLANGHSVLIFCPTKNWCEKLCESIAREFYNILKNDMAAKDSAEFTALPLSRQALSDVVEQLRRTPVGLDTTLGRTVYYGVAYHHAGLTFDERDIVEGGFRQGIIKVLIATSTLSSGVNLPARRVIVRTPVFHAGKMIDFLTYKQMIGRAGRKGVDTEGESILICKGNERSKAMTLVSSTLPPVNSCLVRSQGEQLSSRIKRAILEIVVSGVASSPRDVVDYISCTMLAASVPVEDEQMTDMIQVCITFLQENEFVSLQKTKEQDGTEVDRFVPSQLGSAVLASSMSPDEGLTVFAELRKARQCFVLENELHIIYLVTPIYTVDLGDKIDWYQFYCMWEKLTPDMKRVAELVGVQEGFLAKAIRGRLPTKTPAQARAVAVHRRFYTALVLHDLVHEVPLGEVARHYNCNKGQLQSLQQSAATFAGMVTVFCARLGWYNLELILSQFQNRLTFGVQRELCDLVRLTLLNGQRARVLFNAGFQTVAALASAAPADIETVLKNSAPFQSKKKQENESEWEAEQRRKSRCIWLTGRKGATEQEAALAIIGEAKALIQEELGGLGIQWRDNQGPEVTGAWSCDKEAGSCDKGPGPSGTGMGPSDKGVGPSDKGVGPSGTGVGTSGTEVASRYKGVWPSGTGEGPSDKGAGPCHKVTRPSDKGAGPSGTEVASRDKGAGPSGTGEGPSDKGAGPSGTGVGSSGTGTDLNGTRVRSCDEGAGDKEKESLNTGADDSSLISDRSHNDDGNASINSSVRDRSLIVRPARGRRMSRSQTKSRRSLNRTNISLNRMGIKSPLHSGSVVVNPQVLVSPRTGTKPVSSSCGIQVVVSPPGKAVIRSRSNPLVLQGHLKDKGTGRMDSSRNFCNTVTDNNRISSHIGEVKSVINNRLIHGPSVGPSLCDSGAAMLMVDSCGGQNVKKSVSSASSLINSMKTKTVNDQQRTMDTDVEIMLVEANAVEDKCDNVKDSLKSSGNNRIVRKSPVSVQRSAHTIVVEADVQSSRCADTSRNPQICGDIDKQPANPIKFDQIIDDMSFSLDDSFSLSGLAGKNVKVNENVCYNGKNIKLIEQEYAKEEVSAVKMVQNKHTNCAGIHSNSDLPTVDLMESSSPVTMETQEGNNNLVENIISGNVSLKNTKKHAIKSLERNGPTTTQRDLHILKTKTESPIEHSEFADSFELDTQTAFMMGNDSMPTNVPPTTGIVKRGDNLVSPPLYSEDLMAVDSKSDERTDRNMCDAGVKIAQTTASKCNKKGLVSEKVITAKANCMLSKDTNRIPDPVLENSKDTYCIQDHVLENSKDTYCIQGPVLENSKGTYCIQDPVLENSKGTYCIQYPVLENSKDTYCIQDPVLENSKGTYGIQDPVLENSVHDVSMELIPASNFDERRLGYAEDGAFLLSGNNVLDSSYRDLHIVPPNGAGATRPIPQHENEKPLCSQLTEDFVLALEMSDSFSCTAALESAAKQNDGHVVDSEIGKNGPKSGQPRSHQEGPQSGMSGTHLEDERQRNLMLEEKKDEKDNEIDSMDESLTISMVEKALEINSEESINKQVDKERKRKSRSGEVLGPTNIVTHKNVEVIGTSDLNSTRAVSRADNRLGVTGVRALLNGDKILETEENHTKKKSELMQNKKCKATSNRHKHLSPGTLDFLNSMCVSGSVAKSSSNTKTVPVSKKNVVPQNKLRNLQRCEGTPRKSITRKVTEKVMGTKTNPRSSEVGGDDNVRITRSGRKRRSMETSSRDKSTNKFTSVAGTEKEDSIQNLSTGSDCLPPTPPAAKSVCMSPHMSLRKRTPVKTLGTTQRRGRASQILNVSTAELHPPQDTNKMPFTKTKAAGPVAEVVDQCPDTRTSDRCPDVRTSDRCPVAGTSDQCPDEEKGEYEERLPVIDPNDSGIPCTQASFTVMDVCADRQLFDTFIKEWSTKSNYAVSIACEKMPQQAVARGGIGGKFVTNVPQAVRGVVDGMEVEGQDIMVVGVAVCWENRDAYYLALTKENSDCDLDDSLTPPPMDNSISMATRVQALQTVLELGMCGEEVVNMAMFDCKASYSVLVRGCGIAPLGRFQDPKVACWLMDPGAKEKNLHRMVTNYLPTEVPLLDGIGGGVGFGSLGMTPQNPGSGRYRATTEAVLTLHLMEYFRACLHKEGLYRAFQSIEMPSIVTLARMELNGFGFSQNECESQQNIMTAKLTAIEGQAYQLAGHPFSLTSIEDIGQVLFIELQLPPNGDPNSVGQAQRPRKAGAPRRGRQRAQFSTSKDVLEKLQKLHPLPGLILEWRRISSALTKVVFPLQKEKVHIPHLDMYRIFCECQFHTATGRVSLSEPNLQNVPKDFEISLPDVIGESPPVTGPGQAGTGRGGKSKLRDFTGGPRREVAGIGGETWAVSMRHAFIPFKDGVMLAADYSQLELRMIAHLSGDAKLMRILNQDGDVFKMIAAQWKSVSVEHVTPQQRQQAKQVCYGMVYGIGPKALGEQLEVEDNDAAVFIETFKSRYPGMRTFLRKTVETCREKGYVETLLGRRRYLPAIKDTNPHARAHAERQAVNTTVQGSAADLVKKAMNRIDVRLSDTFPECSFAHRQKPADRGIYGTRDENHRYKAPSGGYLVLQLHDELIYEVSSVDLMQAAHIIKHEMEHAMEMSVRMPVKVKSGPSWGKMEDMQL